jgi:hypothetical protein
MRTLIDTLLGTVVTLWTAFTVVQVMRHGAVLLLEPGGTGRIMSVQNDGVVHASLGLTYHGVPGALLAIGEILVVLVAQVFGLFGRGWLRLAARLVIVAWASLWFGNAHRLQGIGWDRATDETLLGLAALLAVAWAVSAAWRSSAAGVVQHSVDADA